MKTILSQLLIELGSAYEKSLIKQYCLENGHEWHYSLVTSTLKPGGPLVLGFNWGVSQGEDDSPQPSIDESSIVSEEVGSLSRIFPFCVKYFGDDFLSRTSQSNYCFFRSQKEDQIKDHDIHLCEPIFEKLIEVIAPSSILCFSSKLRDYLLKNGRVHDTESKVINFKRGSTLVGYKAIRATLKSGTKIKFLPHPNYPMKREARSDAWEFCCENG